MGFQGPVISLGARCVFISFRQWVGMEILYWAHLPACRMGSLEHHHLSKAGGLLVCASTLPLESLRGAYISQWDSSGETVHSDSMSPAFKRWNSCVWLYHVAVQWIILWRHYVVACKYEVESSLSTASSLKWQQMDVFRDGRLWDYLISCFGISRVISSDPSNLREGLLSPFYRWHSERISDLSKVKWLISGNATVQTFICWSAKSVLSLSPYTDQTFLGQ